LEFLKFFYKYLEENELEVQIAALNSFKDVGKFIPAEHVDKEIVPRINEYFLKPLSIATQNQNNLMGQQPMFNSNGPSDIILKNSSLAENLMYIGANLPGEVVKKSILPIFDILISSEHPEIRIKLFDKPQLLLKVFGSTSLLDIVTREFTKLSKNTNWRVRNNGLHLLQLFSSAMNENLLENNEIVSKLTECLNDQVILLFV
jgi:hypothetical protein